MQNITVEQARLTKLVQDLLEQAKQKGASSVEVAARTDNGFTATVRMGEIDTLEYQRDKGVGITVYFKQRKGSASTTDTTEESLIQTLQAACDIAKFTQEDSAAGLADKALMAYNYPNLDLYHPWDITPEQAIEKAKQCEAKGLSFDKRIFNSEGATVASHQGLHVYANSHGFIGGFHSSRHSISCVLVAKDGTSMQRDYDYSTARDATDLASFDEVAQRAAERTISRLRARRIKTQKAPVIFQAEIAKGLLGSFISAISGSNLYRESSFLLNSLGKKIFPDKITLTEDPHILKALGSAPFDEEGVITKKRNIVEDGVLQGYVLNSYSARKLGMQTTGNAGGVHNLIINHSSKDLKELLHTMGSGLLVTEVIGHGVNLVTGDYSRGAAGFWIEQGKIAFPVEEITIAGNLKDMYQKILEVANDVDIRGNIHTGSILVAEMMIAGE